MMRIKTGATIVLNAVIHFSFFILAVGSKKLGGENWWSKFLSLRGHYYVCERQSIYKSTKHTQQKQYY
jgi:hypothetical protein